MLQTYTFKTSKYEYMIIFYEYVKELFKLLLPSDMNNNLNIYKIINSYTKQNDILIILLNFMLSNRYRTNIIMMINIKYNVIIYTRLDSLSDVC